MRYTLGEQRKDDSQFVDIVNEVKEEIMANIIHNPRELMNLDRDSLDEILLEDYKNIALLRELLRVTLLQLKTQTE